MCVCLHVTEVPYESRKRQWRPGARATENCEPSELGTVNQAQVAFYDLKCALNHRTISSGPITSIMSFTCNVFLHGLYKSEALMVLSKDAMAM